MHKPNDFEQTSSQYEDYEKIELGGHHIVIKAVKEGKTAKGADKVVVAFDFASDDKQADYFSKKFAADDRPEKKWPNQGTEHIVATYDGQCSRALANFVRSVEQSNPGFKVEWGDAFCGQFKGKKVGGVFGLEEDDYNGNVRKRCRLRYWCSDAVVENAEIPELKPLKGSVSVSTQKNTFTPKEVLESGYGANKAEEKASAVPAGFVEVENDDLPF